MGLFSDMFNGFAESVQAGQTGKRSAGASDGLSARRAASGDLVEQLCAAVGWKVDERKGNSCLLYFNGQDVVGSRILCVAQVARLLLLSSYSDSKFTPANLPATLPASLLRRNYDLTIGAWQMDLEEGEVSLSCDYTFSADSVTPASFKAACVSLVEETHRFDKDLKERGLL